MSSASDERVGRLVWPSGLLCFLPTSAFRVPFFLCLPSSSMSLSSFILAVLCAYVGDTLVNEFYIFYTYVESNLFFFLSWYSFLWLGSVITLNTAIVIPYFTPGANVYIKSISCSLLCFVYVPV